PKRRSVTRPQSRMTALHRQLDVLGSVVRAPDDDDVLETARDEQLAIAQETQVAGPQEWPLARFRQVGRKGFCSLQRPVPVAPRDTATRNPNFADLRRRTFSQCSGIDDSDPSPDFAHTASDQQPCIRRIRGCVLYATI